MKIPIKQIASFLEVRPVRIREKAVQLELEVDATDQLSTEQVRTLIQSYQTSNRIGERTRSLADDLLIMIQKESFEHIPKSDNGKQSLMTKKTPKHDSKILGKRTQKKFTRKGLQKSVRTLVNVFVNAMMSIEFKFIALLVAINVQMQHSAIWFYRLSSMENSSWITAYGYAFMVDLFILVITLEGRLNIAKTFAVLTFFSNVLYFQFWVNFDYTSQSWTNAISSLMVSGIMAYIIYAYTEIFVKIRLAE